VFTFSLALTIRQQKSLRFCRAACAVMRCRDVHLSLRVSRSWILSKRVNIYFFSLSTSHIILVFPCQTSQQYSDRDPLTGASNAGGVGKNRDSRRISCYRIDDWWSGNNNCDRPPCSLPNTSPRISEFLFIIVYGRPRRREQNRTELICSLRSVNQKITLDVSYYRS